MPFGVLFRMWFRELDAPRRPPQPLQVIELPRLFGEDVDNKSAVINQRPVVAAAAFVMRRTSVVTVECFLHRIADGAKLWGASCAADEEKISERAQRAQIENDDGTRLFRLRRFHSPMHGIRQFVWMCVCLHEYSPCFWMYSSTRGGTSP